MMRGLIQAVVMLQLVVLVIFSNTALAKESEVDSNLEKTVTLGPHDHDVYLIQKKAGKDIHLMVSVLNGSKVDIYILEESEYALYDEGKDFNTIDARERTSGLDFTIKAGNAVHLVIDNMDASSTGAPGDTAVDYEIKVQYKTTNEPVNPFCVALCGMGLLGVVLFAYLFYTRYWRKRTGGHRPGNERVSSPTTQPPPQTTTPGAQNGTPYHEELSDGRRLLNCPHCGQGMIIDPGQENQTCKHCGGPI